MFDLHARTVRIGLALVAAAGLQACTDRPTEPSLNPNTPRPLASAIRLACAADVGSRSVRCSAPKPKANADAGPIILGGQGAYVQITAANTAYDGHALFTADLTVQNLTAQVLGTLDGSAVTGVDVFLDTGPVGTGGDVTFAGDGTATFNGSGKPFVHYNQMLDAFGGTSSPRTWTFNVPSTVRSFTFTLLVSANVPENAGVLRWTVERGFAAHSNQLVYGIDSRNVFAFSSSSGRNPFNQNIQFTCDCSPVFTANRFDGAAWHAVKADFPIDPIAAWGSSPTDLWVVGASGAYARYDGSTWTRSSLAIAASRNLTAIWGSSSADVYVIGGSLVFHSSDGSTWAQVAALSATDTATAVYGNGLTDVYVMGHDTLQHPILSHWDGTAWTPLSVDTAANHILFRSLYVHGADVWLAGLGGTAHYASGVWQVFADPFAAMISVHGTDPSNVWAVGFSATNVSARILRWDPVHLNWIVDQSPQLSLVIPFDVWTSGPNDVWMIAEDLDDRTNAVPWHFDGNSWTAVGSQLGILESLNHGTQALNATFGTDASNVWAVGTSGLVLNSGASGWQQVGPRNVGIGWNGVWGTAANDIWIVGDSGQVRHWDGMTLTPVPTPSTVPGESLTSVWGSSVSDVWAAGDHGSILHYSNGTWSVVTAGLSIGQIHAIWGTSSKDLWVVGTGDYVGHYDGNAWTQTAIPAGVYYAIHGYAGGLHPVIVGAQGQVLVNPDSVWTTQPSNTNADLFGLFTDGPQNDLIAVGARGTILRYTGTQWIPIHSGVSNDIRGVWASSLQNIFTVGVGDFIAHGMR